MLPEAEVSGRESYEQLSLFPDVPPSGGNPEDRTVSPDREKRWQRALIKIRNKYGKNAVLRGMSLQEGSTARDRNQQIGGHRA